MHAFVQTFVIALLITFLYEKQRSGPASSVVLSVHAHVVRECSNKEMKHLPNELGKLRECYILEFDGPSITKLPKHLQGSNV